MDTPDWLSRRAYVAALGTALAGCGSPAGDGSTDPGDTATATTTTSSTASATGESTTEEPATPTRSGTPGSTSTATPTPSPGFETPPDLPPASELTSPIETDGPTIGLEPVATGLTQPVGLEALPGGVGADAPDHYIVDQPGEIYPHDGDGLGAEPLLSPPEDVVFGGEAGLLGLALHPAFASNRRYFVRYSAESREGTPSHYSHTAVLVEYRATEDFRGTATDSGRTILEVPQPQGNHNAGAIAFGPDGFLHVAFGDGGSGNDQGFGHADDWYDAVGGGNGQDISENLLGSILRIDVDAEESGKNYAVPEDNPLVGTEALPEQYAWGFRNPWRISFHDGHLFAADVGQRRYEEVSIVVGGGNHGWNVKEGVSCFQAEDCPDESPRGNPLVDPVIAYGHDVGNSVIGGHYYAGDAVPALRNRYVFGDYAGDVFAARPPEEGRRLWPMTVLDIDFDGVPVAFGEGRGDELYLLAANRNGPGTVYRIGPA
jgi:glucose/arabinose dehydrogenase